MRTSTDDARGRRAGCQPAVFPRRAGGLPAAALRRVAACALALIVLSGCTHGDADPDRYPHRPIQVIIPFAPGGGTDVFGRIVKKAIDDEQLLPQPMVVVNIEGAGATIGSRRVKNARPDGYTILLLHEAIFSAQASGMVNYGAESFRPIAGTGEVAMVIAVADTSTFETLNDLLDRAQESPDSITFGANLGALTHYVGLQLEQQRDGAKFRFVQSGGGAKRYGDLKGRHVHVTGFSTEEFIRFREDGLRGLAYLGAERHPAAPELPTAVELGYDIVSSNMFYWWAPQNTPPERIDRLATALGEAMEAEFVRRKMDEIQCRPTFVRDDELRDRIRDAGQSYDQVTATQPVGLPNLPLILVAAMVLALVAAIPGWRRLRVSPALRLTPSRRPLRPQAAASPTSVSRPDNRPRPHTPPHASSKQEQQTPQRHRLAISVGLFTIVYVILLGVDPVPFVPATIAYLAATAALLSPRTPRAVALSLILAMSIPLAIHLVFTQWLSAVLP